MAQLSVDEIRSRKRALAEELAAVRETHRKAQRTADGEAARKAKEWVLVRQGGAKGRLRREALAVYALSGFAPEAVVVFLRGAARQRHWEEEKTDAEVLRVVEDEFMRSDLEEVLSYCDEDTPVDEVALRRAVACVAQWRTVSWSSLQTAERHVAPDTETLALEYERVRRTFATSVTPAFWLGASGARKRGTRLRLRWGGRFGVMKPRDVLPVGEMQGKVVQFDPDLAPPPPPMGIWAGAGCLVHPNLSSRILG